VKVNRLARFVVGQELREQLAQRDHVASFNGCVEIVGGLA